MESQQRRVEDCRTLYIKYRGKCHERIEAEMRGMGHERFSRRIMHTRRERGRVREGWIDRFGWKEDLPANARRSPDKGRNAEQCRNAGSLARNEHEVRTGAQVTLDPPSTSASPAGKAARVPAISFRTPHETAAMLAPKRKFNHQKARRRRNIGARLRSRRRAAPVRSAVRSASFSLSSSPAKKEEQAKACTLNSVSTNSTNSENSTNSSFHAWLKTLPGIWHWDWRHQIYLYEHLQKVTSGECKRLMIFMPPRHGKSELVTVRYSAWRLQQKPEMNIILACYNQSLASRFSRKIKHVIADAEELRIAAGNAGAPACMDAKAATAETEDHASATTRSNHAGGTGVAGEGACAPGSSTAASPFPFVKPRLKNTEAEWETALGGGLRAVGVGGGVTGFGAQLIVVDDPIKSRADAESKKMRDKVWNWFNDDLSTRLEPKGAIILIQTRWHEDDLAGRLLKEAQNGGEEWTVINLPALAEDGNALALHAPAGTAGSLACMDAKAATTDTDDHDAAINKGAHAGGTGVAGEGACVPGGEYVPGKNGDPLDRKPGEALCPERYNESDLEKLRQRLGTYSFSALYQQRPTPAEGVVFKREFFTNIVAKPPDGLKWCRGYDLAVSTRTTADFTASFRVAFDSDGNLYIDAGYRKRVEFPEQKRYILGRIKAELDTSHGIELSLHGQAFMQELRRAARIQGRSFRGIRAEGDKLTRALPWSSLAEEGRVILVKGSWNADLINEALSFPAGQHDDQIDAISLAVSMFTKQGGKLTVF